MTIVPEGECETPTALARRLGLPFTDNLLLTRALTHRSYVNEHPEAIEDNERLEFLGDAVLDFMVGAWLYNHFPELPEGELTRLRSSLVRTEQLSEFAHDLGIGKAMRLGRGETQAGGRERPVLLCATFEALVGALYLQTDIETVANFIHPLLEQTVGTFVFQPELNDPKSTLQEWSQARKYGLPRYLTIQVSGPDHERQFDVEVYIDNSLFGKGTGRSKSDAQRIAAQVALEYIEEQGMGVAQPD